MRFAAGILIRQRSQFYDSHEDQIYRTCIYAYPEKLNSYFECNPPITNYMYAPLILIQGGARVES